jgi:hypothetical protein
LTLRKELSDGDVRQIVQESIKLISSTQRAMHLPISPNIGSTKSRLSNGVFKAKRINNRRNSAYAMDFGTFQPPNIIYLDKGLPSCDHPMNLPEFTETMIAYSAVHEVIHADDHTGGDKLLLATRKHILEAHEDKLKTSMEIIRKDGGYVGIENYDDLASLWAVQYVDMVTHYRGYVVLRHNKFPKLDQIWSRLRNDYFPPNLLTNIEVTKGVDYVFNLFTERIGVYCLIEALDEYQKLNEKQSASYTV